MKFSNEMLEAGRERAKQLFSEGYTEMDGDRDDGGEYVPKLRSYCINEAGEVFAHRCGIAWSPEQVNCGCSWGGEWTYLFD